MLWLLLVACAQNNPAPEAPPSGDEPDAAEAHLSPEEAAVVLSEADVEADVEAERYASRHILIAHEGSSVSPNPRTREEALILANELRERLLSGADMHALAKEHSADEGSAKRGGFLGSTERGAFVAAYELAALALEEGQVSEPVETPFGFHIIRRESLAEIHLRQVIVQYQGNIGIDHEAPPASRDREAAQARIREAQAALDGGRDFTAVCAELSDGPTAQRGCDLGWFMSGELGRAFDEAAFALEPGERSSIVETPFGFHILDRVE